MGRIGFEPTRALWAVETEEGFEVFAGGTRLEAARKLGLETVPVVVHPGLTDDDVARLSDQDNENDEYHLPVSPADVWAEYARLRDEEGWTVDRIAAAKCGGDTRLVYRRIKWDRMPPKIKRAVCDGDLTEGHLTAIGGLECDVTLSAWLTTEAAWVELAEAVVRDRAKNGAKSVAATRADVAAWREFIAYAQAVHDGLPAAARVAFVADLYKRKARTLVRVKEAERAILALVAAEAEAARREAQGAAEQADEAARAAARAAERSEQEGRLLARFHHGDCLEALRSWSGGPIRLLLTDPPYGADYQSNRRWQSRPPEKIAGDDADEAPGLLSGMLSAVSPHLATDAHVLIFCDWRHEPDFRDIVEAAGLTVKGSLVWVKEEHSAGDLRSAFAPRHERIIHAVKGSPEVTPRIADVLQFSRTRESEHPHEKPVGLLQALIRSTTAEGDMIADPFAGAGSTLVAALKENRHFWGAEIDDKHHQDGCSRLLGEVTPNVGNVGI